jgi:hypothetical protein
MSMSQATPVLNALPVNDAAQFDGIWWFRVPVDELSFAKYRALPAVVRYNGMNFRKVSFNTDTGTVSYKQSDAFCLPA